MEAVKNTLHRRKKLFVLVIHPPESPRIACWHRPPQSITVALMPWQDRERGAGERREEKRQRRSRERKTETKSERWNLWKKNEN